MLIFAVFAMTGKRDIKVLTEILDLSDVKVISHRLHTGIGMILQPIY
jgi:transposase